MPHPTQIPSPESIREHAAATMARMPLILAAPLLLAQAEIWERVQGDHVGAILREEVHTALTLD